MLLCFPCFALVLFSAWLVCFVCSVCCLTFGCVLILVVVFACFGLSLVFFYAHFADFVFMCLFTYCWCLLPLFCGFYGISLLSWIAVWFFVCLFGAQCLCLDFSSLFCL